MPFCINLCHHVYLSNDWNSRVPNTLCSSQFITTRSSNHRVLEYLLTVPQDDDWIASKLNTSRTKLICVVQTEDEEQVSCNVKPRMTISTLLLHDSPDVHSCGILRSKADWKQRTLMRTTCPSTVRYIFPSMAGQINCMHAKFFLLSHPTHLRICIPSANLVPYDVSEIPSSGRTRSSPEENGTMARLFHLLQRHTFCISTNKSCWFWSQWGESGGSMENVST